MKRFHFSLERVQRWRRGQADLEELTLRRFLADLHSTDARRLQLMADREQAEIAILSQQTAAAEELASLDLFRRHVRAQSRALDEIRRQQQEKIAIQQQRVIEARRRFELLDRLHQKALGEWRVAFNKEQEDMAADLFLAKLNRS
jgi:hypothetical protein